MQDHVLIAPGGCGAILECLGEGAGSSSEIVRNEALLLLPHLVHANADIQKLVAFEGAFEKLLDVVAQEGRVEGGVIVQDALEGLESLLRYNVSNQVSRKDVISYFSSREKAALLSICLAHAYDSHFAPRRITSVKRSRFPCLRLCYSTHRRRRPDQMAVSAAAKLNKSTHAS